jgi:hypothetical protein
MTARQRYKPAEGELMTLMEAATCSGIPYGVLRDLALDGHLAYVRIDGWYWIEKADFESFIAEIIAAFDPLVARPH